MHGSWSRLIQAFRKRLGVSNHVLRRGLMEAGPLDLRLVGRTVLHAGIVGLAAGIFGSVFFALLEYSQHLVLERAAGYRALRAHGETFAAGPAGEFRPWLLVILPGLGGLASGLLTRFAHEARGGGVDAVIDAFHRNAGAVRGRVLWVKPLASLFTLGTGGSGGREGPTVQIGGALGSLLGDLLRVGPRERRILLVAGIAAGLSAVFRTPLGAALLAVELLYRDGFESDALVPAVLASVVSYSVAISIFGESTLFAHAERYPFVPAHLPLYGLLALLVAALAVGFVSALTLVRAAAARVPGPEWLRPAVGGAVLGALVVPVLWLLNVDAESGRGFGLLGGGYGAVQLAITGSAAWFPEGWTGVRLLLLLCAMKLVASALTIGSGGSAGDFAPSLAIGGLFGGAFGRIAQIVIGDPRIDPGAFALVGMGAFYGGIAHVPLSALVLVCEMAGSYDLLVPLMLAEAVAFVALRRRTLYPAQVPTPHDSPVHRDEFLIAMLASTKVADAMTRCESYTTFTRSTPADEMLRGVADAQLQHVFPVMDGPRMLGLVSAHDVRLLAAERDGSHWAVAADAMQQLVTVGHDDSLSKAAELLASSGLPQLPVVAPDGALYGLIGESELASVARGRSS